MILSKNFSHALKESENISDPWIKTKILTEISQHCKDPKQQLATIKKAFTSALQCNDTNRTVNVSCWPLRELYNLGFKEDFDKESSRLLTLALTDNFSISRENALFSICMSTVKDRNKFLIALRHFIDTCNYRYFWRSDRDCYLLALTMKENNYDPSSVEMVLNCIKKPKIRKRAERSLMLV